MNIFGKNRAVIVGFGRDRSIRLGKAEKSKFTDAYQVAPTKAVILSEDSYCELWTFPFRGFGRFFRMKEVSRQPLIARVLGDAVTLSPSQGYETNYRGLATIDSARLEDYANAADYHATQQTQIGPSKRKGELFLNLLGFVLLAEVLLFAAVVLPFVLPKILESASKGG